MRRALLIVAVLLVGLGLGLHALLRRPAVNHWDIANLPVEPGPLLCFGDSLVAGYGASSADHAYPAQLARLLERPVIPVGTPGQTAAEGLEKLRANPRLTAPLVVVTLGGNDILRRVPLEETAKALGEIFAELQRRGSTVAFTAVESPVPGSSRPEMYRRICRRHGVILIPDILDGILADASLLSDSIHPNDRGYRVVAERIAAVLRPFLETPPRPRE